MPKLSISASHEDAEPTRGLALRVGGRGAECDTRVTTGVVPTGDWR